jgi:hypothetical protein
MAREKHKIKAIAMKHPSERMKLNRRQFMKLGAVTTASGALMSATGYANSNKNKISYSAQTPASLNIEDNPLRITDKCKRMPQKNTIFARQLWDFEFLGLNWMKRWTKRHGLWTTNLLQEVKMGSLIRWPMHGMNV